MDLVVEGTVTDHPTYQPADSNTVYRSLQVSGMNVSVPQAYITPLPPLGTMVRVKAMPSGQNKMRLLSVEAAKQAPATPVSQPVSR